MRGRPKKSSLQWFALVSFMIIVSVIGASFLIANTIVYNPPELEPIETVMTIYDSEGNDITTDFDDAVISRTVTFKVEFTSGSDRIRNVTLVVEGISDEASPGGYWSFSNSLLDESVWTIVYDTLQLNNGHYSFDFYYVEEVPSETYGGDPDYYDVMFSTFNFSWFDGVGDLEKPEIPFIFVIGISVAIAILSVSIYVYSKTKKKKGRRG